MVKRDELIRYIHKIIGAELLERVQSFDGGANGVQVLGTEEVERVVVGVSCNLDFLEEASKDGADFCIFHHGLHLSDHYVYNSRLDLAIQRQLKLVFSEEMTIAGYHAALDIQPDFGNNATIIRELGATRLDIPYFEGWGWVGEFAKPVAVTDLAKRCSALFDHDVFAVYAGPKKITRIGVCSGGAKPAGKTLFEIAEKGIQLHIAGEIAESGPGIAKDAGFNYFAGGHYATEVFGVQELGKRLKKHFKGALDVEFIDIANPL